MFNIEKIYSIISDVRNRLFIAYSGGLDSHVLLHSFISLRQEHPTLRLKAIHVNHDLSKNADQWSEHCKRICEALNVDCIIQKIVIKKQRKSPESAAREARYRAFENLLEIDDCLLTAHHQDDQAETLLLQLLRGAGVNGLSAMPEKVSFGKGLLIRPLLSFSRDELVQYATANQLHYINDESNFDTRFDRNYLRHEVIPLLKKRWPAAAETIARGARHLSETAKLLEILAEQDVQYLRDKKNTLSISGLLRLDNARQRNVIRYWIKELALKVPSRIKLNQIQEEVLKSRNDAMPLVHWEGVEVRRFRDRLYAMQPLSPHDPSVIIRWDLKSPLKLPGDLGVLSVQDLKKQDVNLADVKEVTVRFRQGGERCKISGRAGTHTVKNLFQEWDIPPWQRDRVPLIYKDDNLIGVVGYNFGDTPR